MPASSARRRSIVAARLRSRPLARAGAGSLAGMCVSSPFGGGPRGVGWLAAPSLISPLARRARRAPDRRVARRRDRANADLDRRAVGRLSPAPAAARPAAGLGLQRLQPLLLREARVGDVG